MRAWRAGASRLRTFYGRTTRLLMQADQAVRDAPNDPEARSGRAFVLLNKNDLTSALSEYERAVILRPRDYFLWLELGRARDMADDEQGALSALMQSVSLAPAYAQPRWQLGNVLFRAGREEEAFVELRRAALSDPMLLPNMIDLAWGTSGKDVKLTEELVQPQRTSWRIALAKFFARKGEPAAAVAQFHAAGQYTEQDRRELINDFLSNKRFKEAYEVWASGSGQGNSDGGISRVHDGGFESKLSRDNPGFGWQLTSDAQSLRLSLDRSNPRSGAQCLRVDFNGESNPNQPILAQVILVEPNTRYHLRFATRTEGIVTGGLPLISIGDASSKDNRMLAQSSPLATNSEQWQESKADFKTSATTEAVLITLHRQVCVEGPCPIFGRAWLDDFRLEKAQE